jgi:hypothetical protein
VLAGVDTFTFTPASGRGTLALGGTTYTNFTEEDMEVLEVRATNASTAQTANLAVGSGSGAAQAYAGLTVGSKNLFVREDGTIDSGGVISLQCDSFICDPAGTPSNLTNGHIWYDSASDKFKAREDGSTVDLLPFGSTISTLSGTSETISRASTPTYYRTTNGAAVAVTISPASTGNWVANDIIELEQAGAGAVTLTAGAGVTLNVQADLTLVTNGQYSVVGLKYIGSDVWTVLGNLVPA